MATWGHTLQQKVNHARKDVQAVDHIGGDTAVQAIGVLKVTHTDDALGVSLDLLDNLKLLQLAQYIQDFAAHLGRRAGGEFFPGEAQLDALANGLCHVVHGADSGHVQERNVRHSRRVFGVGGYGAHYLHHVTRPNFQRRDAILQRHLLLCAGELGGIRGNSDARQLQGVQGSCGIILTGGHSTVRGGHGFGQAGRPWQARQGDAAGIDLSCQGRAIGQGIRAGKPGRCPALLKGSADVVQVFLEGCKLCLGCPGHAVQGIVAAKDDSQGIVYVRITLAPAHPGKRGREARSRAADGKAHHVAEGALVLGCQGEVRGIRDLCAVSIRICRRDHLGGYGQVLFGIDGCQQGEIYLHGEKVTIKKPEDAIKAGIGFITENRKTEGLILDFSILKNIALPSVDTFATKAVINDKKEYDFSNDLSHKLGVKTASIQLPAGALSGGNQQKVVIAKWIGMHPSIIIMDEPTRGIDVGAKRDIYDLMNELTAQGVSIIMVSSDLPEVIGMSDRVLVVHEGKIAGEIPHEEATQENIITLATGGI